MLQSKQKHELEDAKKMRHLLMRLLSKEVCGRGIQITIIAVPHIAEEASNRRKIHYAH